MRQLIFTAALFAASAATVAAQPVECPTPVVVQLAGAVPLAAVRAVIRLQAVAQVVAAAVE